MYDWISVLINHNDIDRQTKEGGKKYEKIFNNRSTNSAVFCALQNIFQFSLPFYASKKTNPFLTSRISSNHDEG